MQPIPRYHIVATRLSANARFVGGSFRHICAVEDPCADQWQICDDRTAVLATCYSRENAEAIVADANRGAATSASKR